MPTKLDPITHKQRGDSWRRFENRIANIVDNKEKRGFNRRYWFRIIRAAEKMEKIGAARKWPAFKIMQKKAFLTGKMLAYSVDHTVKAHKIGLEELAKRGDAEAAKELTEFTPSKRDEMWRQIFDESVQRYRTDLKTLPFDQIRFIGTREFDPRKYSTASSQEMLERDTIAHLMHHLPDLILPPRKILAIRDLLFEKHHKGRMERMIQPDLTFSQKDREAHLMTRVNHALRASTNDVEKARKICFAASIYADAEEQKSLSSKPQTWTMSYADAMFIIFDKINEENPTVIDAIQALK